MGGFSYTHFQRKGVKKMGKFWKITNDTGADAELLLYGAISDSSWYEDDITPRLFATELKALGGMPLTVRVNSPGGDVFAAQSIYNLLKSYSGHVTVRVDGLAASAATIVTCAGDTIIMPRNALYMIHNPSTMAWGDAKEMRTTADVLDTVRETILSVYRKRTGDRLTNDELTAMMDEETWLTADEALAYGFVDRIDEESKVANRIKDGLLIINSVSCELDKFKHADRVKQLLNYKEGEKNMGESTNELLTKIKDMLSGTPKTAEPVEGKAMIENALQAERARIVALDALDDRTNPAVTEIINLAKTFGDTAEHVQPYIDAVKKATETKSVAEEIGKLIEDHLKSGAENVAPSTPVASDEETRQASIDEVVALANMKRG